VDRAKEAKIKIPSFQAEESRHAKLDSEVQPPHIKLPIKRMKSELQTHMWLRKQMLAKG
jgi:hypothetical protein